MTDGPISYRGFWITYDRKPYVSGHDWTFAHKDYDGPEDGRAGTAATFEAATREVDEMIAEMTPTFSEAVDDLLDTLAREGATAFRPLWYYVALFLLLGALGFRYPAVTDDVFFLGAWALAIFPPMVRGLSYAFRSRRAKT